MIFIPIFNIDAVTLMGKTFKQTSRLTYLRKNRKFDASMKGCSKADEYGVDLNRNYGFKFGIDEEGSSS